MELDRRYITRRDFPAARRGYDPDEVDQHLRELADAVEDLRRQADQPPAPASVAGAAADQVRTIVEAAERSAMEIEQRAEADARQTREAAEADARTTREGADMEAVEHIRRVEEATRGMLDRAGAAESQIDQVVQNLRSTTERIIEGLRASADGMVSDVRSGADGIGRELEQIRRGLGEVRDARSAAAESRPAPPPAAEPAYEPEPEPEPEPYEPEPEPEPEPRYEPQPAPQYHEPEQESLKVHGDELPDLAPAHDIPPAPEREPFQPEAGPPDAEPEVVRDTRESVEDAADAAPQRAGAASGGGGSEGARLIALNMALNGTPRDETAAYLSENFDIADQDALLDEVYSRAGG